MKTMTVNRREALKLMGTTAGVGLAGAALANDREEGFSPRRRKFVLIHGAWHGGFAWDGVALLLRGVGR